MHNRRPSLTIGIPAYNEQNNILFLLSDLKRQVCRTFKLEQLIVSSDGSTDKTVEMAKSFKGLPVRVISNHDHRGVARGLNQIISYSHTDILVLLDSDIRIPDPEFLNLLITPLNKSGSSLTSARLVEFPASTFISQTLNVSMQLKSRLFEAYKRGNNLYTCHGPACAFSRDLYSAIRFPPEVGNDMYSYLYCISRGLTYTYVPKTFVIYKTPDNLSDHRKQSLRYQQALEYHSRIFSPNLVGSELRIPLTAYLLGSLNSLPILLRYPFHTAFYVAMILFLYFESRNSAKIPGAWEISPSTKTLKNIL